MYPLRYADFQKLLSATGIISNLVLIYLVITRSPSSMRPCKFVISIKALIDFLAAVMNFYTTERLVSTTQTILIISEGPCPRPLQCFSGHMLLISFLQQNLVWQVVSYIFRYYILRFRNPSAKSIIFTCFACYSPSFVHSTIWISSFAETVKDQFPPRIFSKPDDNVMAGLAVYQSTWVVLIQLTTSSFVVFGFYLWIRYKLIRFITENSAKMSRNSLVLNKQMLKTAHSQSIIPISILIGSFFFFSMHFSLLNPINFQYFPSIFFILPTIISPIGYILFLPPYWNFCFGAPRKCTGRKLKSKFRFNVVESSHTVSISANVSIF